MELVYGFSYHSGNSDQTGQLPSLICVCARPLCHVVGLIIPRLILYTPLATIFRLHALFSNASSKSCFSFQYYMHGKRRKCIGLFISLLAEDCSKYTEKTTTTKLRTLSKWIQCEEISTLYKPDSFPSQRCHFKGER